MRCRKEGGNTRLEISGSLLFLFIFSLPSFPSMVTRMARLFVSHFASLRSPMLCRRLVWLCACVAPRNPSGKTEEIRRSSTAALHSGLCPDVWGSHKFRPNVASS